MPDAPDDPRPDDLTAPPPQPALPYLDYTRRPPSPRHDPMVAAAVQFAGGFGFYWVLMAVLKALSAQYRWDIGAICGTWIVVLILTFGVTGWLAEAHGYRGLILGVAFGFVTSLFLSALIVREGW